MHFPQRIWNLLRAKPRTTKRTYADRPTPTQLVLETLEDRCTPSANTVATLTGTAFIDHNGTGIYSTGDVTLPGLTVTITGESNSGVAVNSSVVTDTNGNYTFTNVLPGHYELSTPSISGLLGNASTSVTAPAGVTVAGLTVQPGASVGQGLGFLGLAPTAISQRLLASTTQNSNFPDGSASPGSGPVSLSGPIGGEVNAVEIASIIEATGSTTATVTTTASNAFQTGETVTLSGTTGYDNTYTINAVTNSTTFTITATEGLGDSFGGSASVLAPTAIDLASLGVFTDSAYQDSEITFNTNIGALNVTLYDAQDPQTVANFYDYINSGAYNDAFFSRLVSNFVLQGGGATVVTDASGSVVGLAVIPTLPAIPNEFQASNSNVFGTIAMAQSGGNINSATNQFFFNIANNASSLDSQSFVVFGAVTSAADQQFLTNLNNLATTNAAQYSQDVSSSAAASSLSSVLLNSAPLPGYTGGASNFPAATTLSNYILVKSVTVDSRPESLTYKITGNTNPGLVQTTLTNEQLALTYASGVTGSSTITVQATNQNGATSTTSFTVTK